MNVSGAVLSLALVTFVYLGALVWVDAQGGLMRLAPNLMGVLGTLITVAMTSWLVRFCRWHWLTHRAGFTPSATRSLLAYLAGFSFTATPGKVGELIRIRYFEPMGLPPRLVVGLFIYERCLDLLAVLLLATLAAHQFEQFRIASAFAVVLVVVVLAVAGNPAWLAALARTLDCRHFGRLAMATRVVAGGLADARRWANWIDVTVSLGLGLLAWGLLALSFHWLLGRLGADVPVLTALAIYPLSMLVGAASMLPGGLGSTEATIVILLVSSKVAAEVAVLAAVGARLSSLWASILFGVMSMWISEVLRNRKTEPR